MADREADFANLTNLANNKNPLYALTQNDDGNPSKEPVRGTVSNQQMSQNRMDEPPVVAKLGPESSTSSTNSPSPPNTGTHAGPPETVSQNNKPASSISNISKTPGSPQKEPAKESPESTLNRQDKARSQMIRKPSKHEPEDVRDVLRCPRVNCPEKIVRQSVEKMGGLDYVLQSTAVYMQYIYIG